MDIVQKPLKKVTNEEKIAICEKYEPYLRIINDFGNKVMLNKQLGEFAHKLGIASAHATFLHHVKELLEADIIKTEPFIINGRKTQHKIIILKKFALRYLKGETSIGGSQKVAPVPSLKSNDRILLSIFKSSFILQRVLPKLQEKSGKIEFESIVNYIKSRRMSILHETNRGLEYAKWFRDEFNDFLNDEINEQIHRLEEIHSKRVKGLVKGSKAIEGKGKASIDQSGTKKGHKTLQSTKIYGEKDKNGDKSQELSRKEQKIADFSFESMIRANLHIIQSVKKYRKDGTNLPSALHINAVLFDYKDTQDLYVMSKQIACLYRMLNGLMGKANPENINEGDCELYLKVGIVAFSEQSMKTIKEKANESIYSRFNDENNKRIKLSLKNWGIEDNKFLEVTYLHYDIENRYLEGKKYANLLQGRPKKQESKANQE